MWNILLVDDEKNEREGMKFLIDRDRLPLRIFQAANGKQALEVMRKEKIDILLTDVKMPYMDGLELSMIVHQEQPDVQIIIFSAYSEFDYAKKAMQAQVVNYLLKPIELDEFYQVMDKVIQGCEEKVQKAREARSLLEADKQMVLFDLMLGRAEEDIYHRLEKHGIFQEGEKLLPVDVMTKDRFFDEKEEVFLKVLKRCASCGWEYLNLYPNESFVIFHHPGFLGKNRIEEIYRQVDQSLYRETGINCTFLAGRAVDDVLLLQQEAKAVSKMKNEIYEYSSALIWLEDYEAGEFGARHVDESRDSLLQAIENGNLEEIQLCTRQLTEAVAAAKSISAIYIHHVFYDLLDKMYRKFQVYDQEHIYSRINRLVSCTGKEGLEKEFQEVFRELSGIRDRLGEEPASVAGQVKKIIQKEYSRDLSLDYIAEKVNFNPSYLSYMFKKETGNNLVKYITDFRMEKARSMLEESNMKVVQVAKQCGYENTSYFNRLFKNYFGMSPKQYKERQNIE